MLTTKADILTTEETISTLDDEGLKCVGSALLMLLAQRRAPSVWSMIDILKRIDDGSAGSKAAAARAIEKLIPFT